MILKYLLAALTLFILNSPSVFAENVKSIAGISFAAPDTWKESEPSSSMRAYQFELPGTSEEKPELVVFYFGEGQGGAVQANIDRWKGQFTSVNQEKIEPKTVGEVPVHKVYFEGTYQQTAGPMMMPKGEPRENSALLGAVIEAPKGAVFLKATGSKEDMTAVTSEFEALINSVKKAE